jgi:hypothetical protein
MGILFWISGVLVDHTDNPWGANYDTSWIVLHPTGPKNKYFNRPKDSRFADIVGCISAVERNLPPIPQEAFREALACTPPDNLATDQQASAHFGLAATLQYAADCILTGSRCAADKDVKALEESARLTARQLLQQSVLEYKQVRARIVCESARKCILEV